MATEPLQFRNRLREGDVSRIVTLLRDTGVFSPGEVAVAEELLRDGYERGDGSYYRFIVGESGRDIEAYVCYAYIGATGSCEVYWVAVRKVSQGIGIGRRVMTELENEVRRAGAKRIFVGTSSRPEYEDARRLYERAGYSHAALIEDYFGAGDHQVVYAKRLGND